MGFTKQIFWPKVNPGIKSRTFWTRAVDKTYKTFLLAVYEAEIMRIKHNDVFSESKVIQNHVLGGISTMR